MIEILQFKPLEKNSLIGFCNIRFTAGSWSLIINEISLFRKGSQQWIGLPSKVYEKDGEKRYWPYIRFEGQVQLQDFQKQLFVALNLHLAATANQASPEQKTSTSQQANWIQDDLPF